MRSKGVVVGRSLLSGTILLFAAGIAVPAAAQIVTASGKVTVNVNPAQVKALRKSASYSTPTSTITATTLDDFTPETSGPPDGWPETLIINVNPVTDPAFKIRLQGGSSNLVTGSFCAASGGRTSCDPSVMLLDAGGSELCAVRTSSYTISKIKLGFPPNGPEAGEPFVYSVAGTYSAQCFGETTAFTGTFSLNQTTTTKFNTAPTTSFDAGTARCNGEGGWTGIGTTVECFTEPPVATAHLARSGDMSLTLSADAKGALGGLPGNKTYRFTDSDGDWFSYLRGPTDEFGDFNGDPPVHLEVAILPEGAAKERTGVFEVALKNRHFGITGGIQVGAFEFGDDRTQPHFEIQLNLDFCTGGVVSTYNVTEYTYDCEFAKPIIVLPNRPVIVVPHLRTFNVTFTTRCGNEGTYRGTLAVDDDASFDCGNTPSGGGSSGGGGGTGGGGLDGGGGTSGGGSGDGGDSGSGGGGTTSSSAPRVNVPSSVVAEGIVLNNQQSATVNLTTSVPSGFNSDVELAAFSEPEGLIVSVSPSAIAAPGAGTSVLTITAGPDTRPQEYRVLLSATGDGKTSYSVVKVSVLCDPPMILGLDQPRNATRVGGSATLEVKTIGSGPVSYQWFNGQSGATADPVEGATGRTFTTSTAGTYWVRATNPCGSVDSNAATVQ